jgi:hypothetical protein
MIFLPIGKRMIPASACGMLALLLLAGCSHQQSALPSAGPSAQKQAYFHVDPKSAASIKGIVQFSGQRPTPKLIDMSDDSTCVQLHHGKPYDEALLVSSKNRLANVFVYVEKGLEGKNFEVPSAPAVITQTGCWFVPRVIGIQIGQVLQVVNADPITHNIHPLAVINKEWNHSQAGGDPPMERRFSRPEIMIPVKCNIHSWMRAWIGVLPHPYFAVSNSAGAFEIPNLPPGTYTIAAWQEKLGTERQTITVPPSGKVNLRFVFHSK